ncbi:ABC transporter permease [Sphingobacterium sp. N143]|uniref:ABC transporter permease n=1 Tax=Sphingobacterium sp. N143 TaxID=2746727 RepID=UPI002578DC16|nr:ABC transporter permease [Sphingobacterium sp. N143]MDM1294836.1 ABC transporter permease [Sphingobacterium sp. N143]
MIKNYLKIAWRNIRKNKGFSLLNMFGLSLGITCFLLLSAYIYHESSYERFLPHADRLAYLSLSYKAPNSTEAVNSATTPTGLAPTLQTEFPEVEQATRLYSYIKAGQIESKDAFMSEKKLMYADANFFNTMGYTFIEGDPKHALAEPNQIVLTQKLAAKYFPNQTAIGKIVVIDKVNWKVTGVIQDLPTNTQLNFTALLSNKGLKRYKEPAWSSANDMTIALLKNKSSFASVQQKLDQMTRTKFAEAAKQGYQFNFFIERLTDIHLHSKTAGSGNMTYIYILMALGTALIVLTCINFTNLTLAHAIARKKEIGVKKVLGAARKTIFFQFFLECSLMISLSLSLSLFATFLLLPVFSSYMGSEMRLAIWTDPRFYTLLFLFFVLLTLISGGWPAYSIASSKPISIFSRKLTEKQTGISFSKILVTFQFSISIFFIICTLFASRQMHFIQSKNTGLDRSDILVIDGRGWQDKERQLLKDKLMQLNSIQGVTASYDNPVNIQGGYSINTVEGQPADFEMNVTAIPIEKDFISVFHIQSVAGAPLTDVDILRARDTVSPEYSFVINTLAASAMGFTPQQAIGKKINLNGRHGSIKQVVASFNFASLHHEIKPVVLFPEYNYFGNIFIRINPSAPTQDALTQVRSVIKDIEPKSNFEYHFLDDDYRKLYLKDQQTTKVMQLFSMITLVIACMGLFALSAYAVQQRVKEIGIRKVLGASIFRIVKILSVDFMLLVAIALLISIPVGWYTMHHWMDNFAYHITLDWWIFMIAGASALSVSFMTISFQTIKAALTNPIDSLRDE